jgi:quercetin dioxygenase-like cupin family protein
MKKLPARLALCATFMTVLATDVASPPQVIYPELLTWSTPPPIPDLRSAWVLGSEQQTGSYAIRVVLKAGGRVPPHTHPDTRYSTVLSGVLHVGFGAKPDAAAMIAVPAGAVYVAPAGIAHHLWARDGEVVYQEAGVGPTGTTLLPASAAASSARP